MRTLLPTCPPTNLIGRRTMGEREKSLAQPDSSSGSGVQETSGFMNQHRCVLRF